MVDAERGELQHGVVDRGARGPEVLERLRLRDEVGLGGQTQTVSPQFRKQPVVDGLLVVGAVPGDHADLGARVEVAELGCAVDRDLPGPNHVQGLDVDPVRILLVDGRRAVLIQVDGALPLRAFVEDRTLDDHREHLVVLGVLRAGRLILLVRRRSCSRRVETVVDGGELAACYAAVGVDPVDHHVLGLARVALVETARAERGVPLALVLVVVAADVDGGVGDARGGGRDGEVLPAAGPGGKGSAAAASTCHPAGGAAHGAPGRTAAGTRHGARPGLLSAGRAGGPAGDPQPRPRRRRYCAGRARLVGNGGAAGRAHHEQDPRHQGEHRPGCWGVGTGAHDSSSPEFSSRR